MPETQTKGSYTKGGKSPQTWPNLREDTGGKTNAKSDWATKIKEREVAKQIPLLSEFPGYSVWGMWPRWTTMLYKRPISSVVDYVFVNLKDSGDLTRKEASGYAKHKSKSKTDENEEAIENWVCYEPIDYEWMFEVSKSMYQEQAGSPIARIAIQLGGLETIIYRELGVGANSGSCLGLGREEKKRTWDLVYFSD